MGVVNMNGFDSIYTIRTKTDVKYLMIGGNVGCNSCYNNYAQLIRFVNGKLVKYFDYGLSRRGFAGEENVITYDQTKKRLTVKYTTDDFIPVCICETMNEREHRQTDNLGKIVPEKECKCVYSYNGTTFILDKK